MSIGGRSVVEGGNDTSSVVVGLAEKVNGRDPNGEWYTLTAGMFAGGYLPPEIRVFG
jgi:hypothetical protein